LDRGWFVAAGNSRFKVRASYDLRLADTIYIHDEGNPELYFEAHLLDTCSHFRGLSHREVEALGFLRRQLNQQGEQQSRQLAADYHASIAPIASQATAEMRQVTKGKSRSSRKQDTRAAREDARRHERQEAVRPTPQPMVCDTLAEVIHLVDAKADAPSAAPELTSTTKSRQQKYQELLNGR
jgi:hypothetical protein